MEGPALLPPDATSQQQAESLLRSKDGVISAGLMLASGSDSRCALALGFCNIREFVTHVPALARVFCLRSAFCSTTAKWGDLG